MEYNPQCLYSVRDIMRQHDQAGSYWFTPDTMRFFRTRLCEAACYPSEKERATYFVTSEQPPHGSRKYSVRKASWDNADISTIGEFCGYATRGTADRAAKRMAKGEP